MRYPEVGAGGYTRVDGSVAFYGRVQAVLAELDGPVTIVDFGAGPRPRARTTRSPSAGSSRSCAAPAAR